MKKSTIIYLKTSATFFLLMNLSINEAIANPNPIIDVGGLIPLLVMAVILLLMLVLLTGYAVFVLIKKQVDNKIMTWVMTTMWVQSLGVLIIIIWYAWNYYPTDKEMIVIIPAVVLVINGLLFSLNMALKKLVKINSVH